MGEFESREQGFEAKFAHDQEVMFKAKARRDALAGRWVVGQLGLTGAEADAYLQSLVALAVRKDHEQAIVQKLLADFAQAKIEMSEHRLRRQLSELMEQAIIQVKSEPRT
jgi:hypothetical protein